MISSPFPSAISFVCLHENAYTSASLLPAEAALLSEQTVAKRIKEFTLGRLAAHQALRQLGVSSTTPILQGKRREPLWPNGIVGTISHTGPYAICAVAWQEDYLSIGLDIEEISSQKMPEIEAAVAFGEERIWINQDPGFAKYRAMALFSAKETTYKLLYPHCKKFLDFNAVSIVPIAGSNQLRAIATKDTFELLPTKIAAMIESGIEISTTKHIYLSRTFVVTSAVIKETRRQVTDSSTAMAQNANAGQEFLS